MGTYLSNKAVGACENGVNLGAHADQAAGHGVLEDVLLRKERHDAGVDGHAVASLGDDAGTDLDLIALAKDSAQNGTSSDTSLQMIGNEQCSQPHSTAVNAIGQSMMYGSYGVWG